MQSQVSVQYAPVTVQPKPNQRPGTTSASSTSSTLTLKVPLRGLEDIDDHDADFVKVLKDKEAEAFRNPKLISGGVVIDPDGYRQFVYPSVQQEIQRVKANLKRQLAVAVSLIRVGDSQATKRDSLGVQFDISKVLGRKDEPLCKSPLALAATLSESWLGKLPDHAGYRKTSASFGSTVTVPQGLDVGLQALFENHSGRGFNGIPGVANTSRRTDFGLAEVFTFRLAGKWKLAFSVKEIHLGTGNTDVRVSTLMSFDPARRNPHS